nr:MAG TPA: fibrinogen [Caudoviricetes sp.]
MYGFIFKIQYPACKFCAKVCFCPSGCRLPPAAGRRWCVFRRLRPSGIVKFGARILFCRNKRIFL